MSLLRLLPWMFACAMVVFAIVTYDQLPERIPQQFDAAGRATRLAERSWLSWGVLPLSACGMLALLQLVSRQLTAHPELFNFPAKAQLLALPRDAQAPVIAQMRTFLDVAALLLVVVLGAAQFTVYQGALGRDTAAVSRVTVAVAVLMAPALLVFVVRITRATERAHAEWVAAQRLA